MLLGFLNTIEARAQKTPDEAAFLDAACSYEPTTWRQLRESALRLVMALRQHGVERGSSCALDMDNCAEFVVALVAAAYGGFQLVALNTRLTVQEKRERARELYEITQSDTLPRLDRATAANLIEQQRQEAEAAAADPAAAMTAAGGVAGDVNLLAQAAQRGFAGAKDDNAALVMFTSGTQGRPKAAALSWGNLLGAAAAANARFRVEGPDGAVAGALEGRPIRWQLALPMYHVGGLAVALRCLLEGHLFVLYEKFDPQLVLRDARHYDITHVSVVDKMLSDLLDVQERAERDGTTPELGKLSSYQVILLGGAAPNKATLQRAHRAQAPVHVSYGLTETASCAASAVAGKGFDGFLSPLAGYEFEVLDPDESGLGQLAVKGPGVFSGYLNAQTSFTSDGFFATGDLACKRDGRIRVQQRSGDMFVSGGENVYPEEIRSKMLMVPDVAEAFVFGIEDATWGQRPAALVESTPFLSAAERLRAASDIRSSLEMRLSSVYLPDHILVLDKLPRTSVGKLDRQACMKLWNERIQVERVELWRVNLPMPAGMKSAKATMKERETLLLRATSAQGYTGLGECVAFATNWYLPETIASCQRYLEATVLPAMMHRAFANPIEAAEYLAQLPGAEDHPLACAAFENALWDIYGKAVGRSIRSLIGGRTEVTEVGAIHGVKPGCVPGGAVLGVSRPKEAVAAVRQLVEQGYRRVKVKVQPGRDVKTIEAIRHEFPDLVLALDANQSYKDTQVDRLRALDEYGIAFIEEPLRPDFKPHVGPSGLFDRLARLQDVLSMPVCLDESWRVGEQLQAVLIGHPELRCVSMKLAKFGGLQQACTFYKWAQGRSITMVCGGMYDTGISKRLHAAFSMLPGIMQPGDISSSSRYFAVDVCDPPFELDDGVLRVNPRGRDIGLGCVLDEQAIAPIVVERRVVE